MTAWAPTERPYSASVEPADVGQNGKWGVGAWTMPESATGLRRLRITRSFACSDLPLAFEYPGGVGVFVAGGVADLVDLADLRADPVDLASAQASALSCSHPVISSIVLAWL